MVQGRTLIAATTSLSLAAGAMFSVASPSYASNEEFSPFESSTQDFVDQATVEAIANATFYNSQTGKIELHTSTAIDAGANKVAVENMNEMFSSMNSTEAKAFLQAINFENTSHEVGIRPQALPAVLLPIAAFLGGAAGGVIVSEVMQYGIAKACQNLKDQYDFFTDFCETRGYI